MKQLVLKIIYRILAYYARIVIKKHNPYVIAVTGSVGKTGTKEAIYKVLIDYFGREKVRRSFGNLNAELGIPLSILGYEKLPNKFLWPIFLVISLFKIFEKKYPQYLVLEMGVEHKGDIAYFTSIACPDIAVITSVEPAHIANFSDIKSYQEEKISIIGNLKEDGKSVVNFDDENMKKLNGELIYSVGLENKAAKYRAENIKVTLAGTEFRIVKAGRSIAVKSRMIGRQLLYGQLFAFAVADIFNLPLIEAGESLEKIKPYPGRMNLVEGKNDTIIIDDTYNANPLSMKAALDALEEINYKGRKVAILGNMNELGSFEKEAHKELAKYAKKKCDLIILIGPNAEEMQKEWGNKNALDFKDKLVFLEKADSLIEKNDLILIKASQNKNFFEEIVKKLMKNPGEAGKLLVRQEKYWQNKK